MLKPDQWLIAGISALLLVVIALTFNKHRSQLAEASFMTSFASFFLAFFSAPLSAVLVLGGVVLFGAAHAHHQVKP